MAFAASRPDPARLVRTAFGEAWLALTEPGDRADVGDVRVRLSLYRSLIERGNAHGGFGAHDELHPLWGYASQLAWQHASGRLGGSGHAIAPASWWGACNYALSVIPYVAGGELGLVPPLAIAADAAYVPVLPLWHNALRAIAAVRPGDELDAVRLAVWRAHLASITIAVARHASELAQLPGAEQRFARGWVRMVDLFAAAALRTDLDRLAGDGGGALPSKVLAGGDDLPRPERSSARRVGALADRPAWRWRAELAVWRRIMRTHEARGDAEAMLAALLGRGAKAWPGRLRALRYALASSRRSPAA